MIHTIRILVLCGLLCAGGIQATASELDPRARIKRVALVVPDLDRAKLFFGEVLRFELASEGMLDPATEPYLGKVFALELAGPVRRALYHTSTERRGLFVMELPGMESGGAGTPRTALNVVETSDLAALKTRAEAHGFTTADHQSDRTPEGSFFSEMLVMGPGGHAFLVYQYGDHAAAGNRDEVTFHRQFVEARTGQVHVLQSLPVEVQKDHPPVVCLAPNPASGNYFRLFMQELGRDRVMIAPDYPGLGDSAPVQERMDMAAYADVMADTLRALGYGPGGRGPVDLCGYHTGAMVAIELAVREPALVRRMVLAGIPYYDATGRAEMYAENVVEKPIEPELQHLQGSWDFAVTHRNEGVSLERGYGNFLDAITAGPNRPQAYHAVFTYPAEERAPLVKQPVLILNTHGSLADETRAIAPMFPNARLVDIPELHHGVFDVGAAMLADHARPFLDSR